MADSCKARGQACIDVEAGMDGQAGMDSHGEQEGEGKSRKVGHSERTGGWGQEEGRHAWTLMDIGGGGGTGIEQAGRPLREDRRVRTGRGQAGKTFKENRRGLDKKWAGRQD
jgi:hypothetical protein